MLKTEWLQYVSMVLSSAFNIAAVLQEGSAHVVIYCQNGVQSTPVLSSMAQIVCDPYYRTFKGLAVLLHKEWSYYKFDFQKRG